MRDHYNLAYYWRDATNLTLHRLRLADVLPGARKSMKLQTGPFFVVHGKRH